MDIHVEPERLVSSPEKGPGTAIGAHPRLSRWAWLIAGAQAAVLLATSTRYGYHRDELYFIAAGGHPAFGYPDQPPLVPLLSWAMHAIAPSLLLLRTPSSLAAAITTLLAALIAREIGGGTRAQIIAAACTAFSAFALAVAHLVSTTTFDLLSTTLLGWLGVRAVTRGSGASLPRRVASPYGLDPATTVASQRPTRMRDSNQVLR